MGHEGHFERAPRTSAFPLIATKLLHYGNRRGGPQTGILRRDILPLSSPLLATADEVIEYTVL